MGGITTLVIVASLTYVCALFMLSGRARRPSPNANSSLFFVFLVPCLNEEVVIRASLERLLALPNRNFAVLVVDDGSDDGTSDVVQQFDDRRVLLLRRTLPNARQGKGEALNAAYRYLCRHRIVRRRKPDRVIVAVLDADGRLEPNALDEVTPFFAQRDVGAVQIGVRMYNATTNLLSRMQDLEFVTFSEVFQRGREAFGSVGLGGNGQFTRLSALKSLGDAPWTECLTEDLDLGIRLMLNGWKNRSCRTTFVSQQAVTTPRRLVRQRTRWFQGHLQCWQRVPEIVRSDTLPRRTTADLTYHLLGPAVLLAVSIPILVAWLVVGVQLMTTRHFSGGHDLTFVLVRMYAITFVPAWIYGVVYANRSSDTNILRGVAYGHAFTLYGYLWIIAGWRATARSVTRRSSWAKTARTTDGVTSASPALAARAAAPWKTAR